MKQILTFRVTKEKELQTPSPTSFHTLEQFKRDFFINFFLNDMKSTIENMHEIQKKLSVK